MRMRDMAIWGVLGLLGTVAIQVAAVAVIVATVVLSEGNVMWMIAILILVNATLSTAMWSWCRFCEQRVRETGWRSMFQLEKSRDEEDASTACSVSLGGDRNGS